MSQPFNQQICDMADSMGISLYQRFSQAEAALVLHCPVKSILQLITQNQIGFITLPNTEIEFFGFMLIEYILEHVSEPVKTSKKAEPLNKDRILRIKEVIEMVGVSRTTLWRMECRGEFPRRVPLSSRSIGWRYQDVDSWIKSR